MDRRYDVVVSDKAQEASVANEIVSALERAGIRCWIAPRNIPPGGVYYEAIQRAIEETQATVFVMSKASKASEHCQRELTLAVGARHRLFPCRIDQAPISKGLAYFLGNIQFKDIYPDPAECYAELIESLKHALAMPAGAPESCRLDGTGPKKKVFRKWVGILGTAALLYLLIGSFLGPRGRESGNSGNGEPASQSEGAGGPAGEASANQVAMPALPMVGTSAARWKTLQKRTVEQARSEQKEARRDNKSVDGKAQGSMYGRAATLRMAEADFRDLISKPPIGNRAGSDVEKRIFTALDAAFRESRKLFAMGMTCSEMERARPDLFMAFYDARKNVEDELQDFIDSGDYEAALAYYNAAKVALEKAGMAGLCRPDFSARRTNRATSVPPRK